MSKSSVLTWSFLGVLIFQNFDLAQFKSESLIQEIDHESRLQHARELLGGKDFLAYQLKTKVSKGLSEQVFRELKVRLPKQDKWQAAPLANLLIEESEKYEVDPVFVMAMIYQESSFNPRARGPVGEIGLMQLRPTTAAWVSEKTGIPYHGPKSLEQPFTNVRLGMAYLNLLRGKFEGQASSYVAAYNMGARNVKRMIASKKGPKEYSTKVMKRYSELYRKFGEQHDKLVARAEAL